MSVYEHKQAASKQVKCMIITVSDTRTKETDSSGKKILQLLNENHHLVVDYRIIPDDYSQIQNSIHFGVHHSEIDVILLNGGTGISPRDTTYEAVEAILEKQLPGFGEIFRFLSFSEDIGSAAMLSRAIAGTIGKTAIFSMPGSTGAVSLAMQRLVLPEMGHVIRELNK